MGRTAIYLIIGFSLIALYFGSEAYNLKFEAMDNAIGYYENIQRTNIGTIGANLACASLFQDTAWKSNYNKVYACGGGTFSINVKDSSSALARFKVVEVKTVYQASDVSGIGKDSSTYTKIVLSPSSFSKFAYFSNSDPSSIVWVTGDSVFGPFHSNTYIYLQSTSAKPVFMDYATYRLGISPKPSATNLKKIFKKGHGKKNLQMPAFSDAFGQLKTMAIEDGYYDSVGVRDSANVTLSYRKYPDYWNHYQIDAANDTVWITFRPDDKVIVRKRSYASNSLDTILGTAGDTTLSDFAPNGVMYFEGFIVKVKGKVNGTATIACSRVGTRGGTILIDSSITYQDTTTYGYSISHDVLGLVATDSVTIANNEDNDPYPGTTQRGVDIHSVIFSLNRGFSAQRATTRDRNGQIRLFGGICQYTRQAVGTTDNNHGFKKSYHYDPRLLRKITPPGFPKTGEWEIISWYE